MLKCVQNQVFTMDAHLLNNKGGEYNWKNSCGFLCWKINRKCSLIIDINIEVNTNRKKERVDFISCLVKMLCTHIYSFL